MPYKIKLFKSFYVIITNKNVSKSKNLSNSSAVIYGEDCENKTETRSTRMCLLNKLPNNKQHTIPNTTKTTLIWIDGGAFSQL